MLLLFNLIGRVLWPNFEELVDDIQAATARRRR